MQVRVDVFLFDDGTSITGTPGVDSLDDVDSLNLFRFSIDGGLANPECEISL
jgi:hypothetical protein